MAHAHDVGQPVAVHVRQKNALLAVGEHDGRAHLLVEGLGRFAAGAESIAALRLVPGEHLVFRDQQVGLAVAGQVDQARIGIAYVDVGHLLECLEAGQVRVEFEIALRRSAMLTSCLVPSRVQVGERQLLPQPAERRLGGDLARTRKRSTAQVALVIPAIGLLRQDARQAFAVQVGEQVRRRDADRRMDDVFLRDGADRFVPRVRLVRELERRQCSSACSCRRRRFA